MKTHLSLALLSLVLTTSTALAVPTLEAQRHLVLMKAA